MLWEKSLTCVSAYVFMFIYHNPEYMHYVSKEFKESERQKIFGMAAEMQSQGNKRKRETENTRTTKKSTRRIERCKLWTCTFATRTHTYGWHILRDFCLKRKREREKMHKFHYEVMPTDGWTSHLSLIWCCATVAIQWCRQCKARLSVREIATLAASAHCQVLRDFSNRTVNALCERVYS